MCLSMIGTTVRRVGHEAINCDHPANIGTVGNYAIVCVSGNYKQFQTGWLANQSHNTTRERHRYRYVGMYMYT